MSDLFPRSILQQADLQDALPKSRAASGERSPRVLSLDSAVSLHALLICLLGGAVFMRGGDSSLALQQQDRWQPSLCCSCSKVTSKYPGFVPAGAGGDTQVR